MTVLDRIKEISKKRGLSLNKVNELSGLGTNIVYSWKTKRPSAESLKAVADVLNVSVDYLLGNTDDMHSNSAKPTDEDLETALDNSVAYGGKPMSDNDRAIIKGLMQAYFDNKEG
jgi:transcriptional regulator with XRE-family HTH domain